MSNPHVECTERQDLLEQIFSEVLDAVVVFDSRTHRIIELNARAAELIGCSREAMLGKTWEPAMHAAAKGQGPILDPGQMPDREESVLRRVDGTEIPVLQTMVPVQWQGRECLVESFVDMSLQKVNQQAQAQLVHELERVNQELKDFAYVVSHDLKAPLRGIRSLADWIAEDYVDKLGEEGKDQFGLLVNRVDRMHDLIEGILAYSRIGRVIEKHEAVDLKELLPIVLDTVAVPRYIEIVIENELPVVQVEKTRITQVFQNLLSNAIKYMDKDRGCIRIDCVDQGGYWQFSIADNGPGIAEKHQERIFQLFQTLAPKDEIESTGVGLTIVKRIVELYGGQIWVESTLGQGCTFFFTLAKRTPPDEMCG